MTTSQHRPPHVLVVANETATSTALVDAVRGAAANDPAARVLVVAPALNTRLRHWASDDREALPAARVRLRVCLVQLRRVGLDANGLVGDADPVLAIGDALRLFPADTLVLATHPEHRSNWLAHRLLDRARSVFDGVIVHLVVDRRADARRRRALEQVAA